MFAEVVVNDPLSRLLDVSGESVGPSGPLGPVYHYDVPEQLCGIQPGHLVWVPFGERRLQGIVVGLADSSPIEETRPLGHKVLDEPVLTPAQLALARWMSAAYLAPLLDCLRLMLSPGLLRSAEPVLTAMVLPPFPSDISPDQRALLHHLQEGPVSLRRLKRQWPHLAVRGVVDPLIRAGLVSRRQEVIRRPLRAKTGRRVRLLADAEEVARSLPGLGHSSKQADVLHWLATSDDPLPLVSTVRDEVDTSDGPIRALAERGWVEIIPRRRLLVLQLSPADVDVALNSDLSRAPAQSTALAALVAQPGPVEETSFRARIGVGAATLRELEERGYVRRVQEEPKLLLRLEGDEVLDAIVELRGARRQMAVLDALLELAEEADEGEPVSEWIGWVYAETGCSLATLRDLESLGLIAIEQEEIVRDPLAGREFVLDRPPVLTPDQAKALGAVQGGIDSTQSAEESVDEGMPDPPSFLLHGVTGSGKTEIYLRAIASTLAAGRQAIVLVPEISLTPQTIRRFAARFPGRVGVVHSELSQGERYDTWRRIRAGKIDIVIGPRSALFQPLPRLGLIVIDEEHDDSYKQADPLIRRLVRYDARRVARELARLCRAPLILGSATPSMETYHAAQRGCIALLELPQRILGHWRSLEQQRDRHRLRDLAYKRLGAGTEACYVELPKVEVVDLRHELRVGNRSIFSRALQEALARTLAARQQAILFLNRRGAATFVICRDCGHVLRCPRCDVPYTYHFHDQEADSDSPVAGSPEPRLAIGHSAPLLVCHHCNRQEPVPQNCPACDSRRIRHFGVGTQRVEREVQHFFPAARTLRWDWDVTRTKGAHEVILTQFSQHRADVLIGTQMIAKGLDLPLVTLVGVVTADTALHLPDYRAGERTFQLLTQVAGRAGRGVLGGRVIVQSYTPDHYAIRAAAHHDHKGFYQQEIAYRLELGYPPFARLAKVVAVDEDELACRHAAEQVADLLGDRIRRRGADASLIGPVPCFFARQRGRFRWQVVVRAWDPVSLLRGLELPPNCWIDVDPVSLL